MVAGAGHGARRPAQSIRKRGVHRRRRPVSSAQSAGRDDRNPIPGLYAAGNVQGDRFALQYPISTPGCSVGLVLFYGYVAGKSAALEL